MAMEFQEDKVSELQEELEGSEEDKVEELEENLEGSSEQEYPPEVPEKPKPENTYKIYLLAALISLGIGLFLLFRVFTIEFTVISFVLCCFLIMASLFLFYFSYRKKKWGRVTLNKFRFTEKIIPADKSLYVLGTAVPTKEDYPESTHNAVVKRTKEHDTLVISDKKEKELSESTRFTKKFLAGGIGIVGSVAGILFLLIYAPIDEEIGKALLILGGILFASITTFYKGFKELGRQQKVEGTPTSKIRSMSMGLVELKGKASAMGEVIRAPFTGEKCIGYYCEVEKEIRTRRSTYWKTIDEFKKYPDFYLEDETGKIAINPEDANIMIENQFGEVVRDLYKLPDSALALVADGNISGIEFDKESRVGY